VKVPRYWRNKPFNYRLAGWRCTHCGTFHHERPIVCRKCGAREFAEVELPKEGKLLAYTILKTPPKEFGSQTPYIIGLIELVDGTRILSQIVDVQEDELRPEMKVELVFRKIREDESSGIIEYGYKFRPMLT